MEVLAKVIVRDDPFTGTGDVLHEETLPLDVSDASLDALVGAAEGFAYDELGLSDWYRTSLEYQATASGGDAETATVVFEALQNLKSVAWTGLGAMFAAYLVRRLCDDSDREG